MKAQHVLAIGFWGLFTLAAMGNSVDTKKSTVKWTGKKVLVDSKHFGTVPVRSGEFTFVKGVPTKGSVVVDLSKLVNQDQKGEWKTKLEGHLKSEDFFHVAKYPTAKLQITKLVPKKGGKFNAVGNLTVKKDTHPVKFPATYKNGMLSANFKFDRTKWDVRYGSGKFFKNLGDKVIADDIWVEAKIAVGKGKAAAGKKVAQKKNSKPANKTKN